VNLRREKRRAESKGAGGRGSEKRGRCGVEDDILHDIILPLTVSSTSTYALIIGDFGYQVESRT